MGAKGRKSYSREFKLDAVRLVEGDKRSVASVAGSLGISESMLHRWREALSADAETAFPGRGRQSGSDAEIASLKRKLTRAQQERDILKKALAYFASESK